MIYTQADIDRMGGEIDELCKIGDGCKIGDRCKIGAWCEIGNYCRIGDYCWIDDWCKIGDDVTLGLGVQLGDGITMGHNITYEGGAVVNGYHVKIPNLGRFGRTAYWYIDQYGAISVRAGCWYGQLDEFKRRVRKVHGGTIHKTMYLAACDYAKVALRTMLGRAKRRSKHE